MVQTYHQLRLDLAAALAVFLLPMSLANMAKMTRAFPDKAFSGIGGVTDFRQAASYFLLGCGTVQVCTAAMLDKVIGPNVIRDLKTGLSEFIERNASNKALKCSLTCGLASTSRSVVTAPMFSKSALSRR